MLDARGRTANARTDAPSTLREMPAALLKDPHAVCHRQSRPDPREYQPGYRAAELEYALNKVQCRALISSERFKTTDYIGILRELAPELAHNAPGALQAARLPHLKIAVSFADTDEPGYHRFADLLALGSRSS